MYKRIISLTLCMVMILTMNTGVKAYAAQSYDVVAKDYSAENKSSYGENGIEGTNAFGSLLQSEIDENNEDNSDFREGYNVTGVTVENLTATVTYQAQEESIVLVGIFSEDGKKMVTSEHVTVTPDETTVTVKFASSLPEYYLVKAYLVKKNTMIALCKEYTSKYYTQDIQDLLSKTTQDFDEELVYNIDEDTTNNFAVYKDGTVLISESKNTNVIDVNASDVENDKYVFHDADDELTGLAENDVLAYTDINGTVYYVKVASISNDADGTLTVTGQSDTLDMEDVFDYVKINDTADTSDAIVDDTTADEGVKFKGINEKEDEEDSGLLKAGIDVSGSKEMSIEYELTSNEDENVKKLLDKLANYKGGPVENKDDDKPVSAQASWAATVGLELEVSLEVYISLGEKYIEFTSGYELSGKITVTGEVSISKKLCTIQVPIVTGVNAAIIPTYEMDLTGELTASISLSRTVGFHVSNDDGYKDLTTAPIVSAEIGAEVEIFIGLKIKVELNIVSDSIAEAGFTFLLGLKADSEYTIAGVSTEEEDSKHDCGNLCIEGTIDAVFSLEYEMSFLKKFTYNKKLYEVTMHLNDFHISFKYGDFGFTECPHYSYKTLINVIDINGSAIKGATVTVKTAKENEVVVQGVGTDSNGIAQVWLNSGEYKVLVTVDNDGEVTTDTSDLEVGDELSKHIVYMGNDSEAFDNVMGDLVSIKDRLKFNKIIVDENDTLLIDTDGNLYEAIVEDGIPDEFKKDYDTSDDTSAIVSSAKLIFENGVKDASLHDGTYAVIGKDDALYMWGSGAYGRLGNGAMTNYQYATKVLSNVKSVQVTQYATAAITYDNELYMWGAIGSVGFGTQEDTTTLATPKIVCENVKEVKVGQDRTCVLGYDGYLYMAGNYSSRNYVLYSDSESVDNSQTTQYPFWKDGLNRCEYNGAVSFYRLPGNVEKVANKGFTSKIDIEISPANNAVVTNDNYLYSIKLDNRKVIKSAIADYYDGTFSVRGDAYMVLTSGGGLYGGSYKTYDSPRLIMSDVADFEMICSWYDHAYVAILTKDGKVYLGTVYYGTGVAGNDLAFSGVSKQTGYVYVSGGQHNNRLFLVKLYKSNFATSAISKAAQPDADTTYSDLTPGTFYNLYVVSDKTASDIFANGNLYYVSQYQADEKGEIHISQDFSGFNIILVSAKRKSIADTSACEIIVPDYVYYGSRINVAPQITYKDEILKEGIDYKVTGDYIVKNSGEHTVVIKGCGKYTGTVKCVFNVKPVSYKDFEALSGKIDSNINQSQDKYEGEQCTSASIDALLNTLYETESINENSSVEDITKAYSLLNTASSYGENGLVHADVHIKLVADKDGEYMLPTEGEGWYAYGDKLDINVRHDEKYAPIISVYAGAKAIEVSSTGIYSETISAQGSNIFHIDMYSGQEMYDKYASFYKEVSDKLTDVNACVYDDEKCTSASVNRLVNALKAFADVDKTKASNVINVYNTLKTASEFGKDGMTLCDGVVSVYSDDNSLLKGITGSGKYAIGDKVQISALLRDDINYESVILYDEDGKALADLLSGPYTMNFDSANYYEYRIDVNVKVVAPVKSNAVLKFSKGSISKTYGAAAFTNGLITKTTDGTLSYTSSKTSVATVDQNGKVTIKGAGTTVIMVRSAATNKYYSGIATYTVTVAKAVNQVSVGSSFTKTASSLKQTFSLKASAKGGAKKTYITSTKSVSVSSNGVVTIAKNYIGKVTITITANATDNYNKAVKKVVLTVNPSKRSITSLKAVSKTKLSVKWSRDSKVSGYQVQYSTKSNFKSAVTKTVSGNKTTSKTLTGLKKITKYYMRVRSYKTVNYNGKSVKIYSSWSEEKAIKTTK